MRVKKGLRIIITVAMVVLHAACSAPPTATIIQRTEAKTISKQPVSKVQHSASDTPVPIPQRDKQEFVEKLIHKFPENFSRTLVNLKVLDTFGKRGAANANTMYIRLGNMSDHELSAIVVHELGHVVDGGFLTGGGSPSAFDDFDKPVYSEDPSVEFYSICWENSKKRKDGSPLDFVSGYAMTDPFEDFGESFAYYVLQGSNFRKMSTGNQALQKKYFFLKEKVFQKREFDLGEEVYDEDNRVYDITLLPYSLDKLLMIYYS